MQQHQSWGRYPRASKQAVTTLAWRPATLPAGHGSLLAYGLGRSQGDSCLNEGGTLIDVSRLDHFIEFDTKRGILRAEAGVTIAAINNLTVPRGWFVPVTPGTKYVTLGGAIANDVHGKNHIRAGTFGRHVTQFELLRSDGKIYRCSSQNNMELYRATIGGLGLTGLITWAEIQLKKIPGQYLNIEYFPFTSFAECFQLANDKKLEFEYLIGQMETIRRHAFGHGVLMGGNHTDREPRRFTRHKRTLTVPFTAPNWLLNNTTVSLYTRFYQYQNGHRHHKLQHYDSYFYPLDSFRNWNRLYGPRGFLQYQCVVPPEASEVIDTMLQRLQATKQTAFLTSLKVFGDIPSPGLLSFPRAGVCIALDVPAGVAKLLQLLSSFDKLVIEAGGRVYPAKDARMSAESFQTYYPNWREFSHHIDPAFSSSFWRRVTS